MTSTLWLSTFVSVVISGLLSLCAVITPAIYWEHPKGMPWPTLTWFFFTFGRWLWILGIVAVLSSIYFSRRDKASIRLNLILIELALSILLIVLAAICMLLPAVNILYWD